MASLGVAGAGGRGAVSGEQVDGELLPCGVGRWGWLITWPGAQRGTKQWKMTWVPRYQPQSWRIRQREMQEGPARRPRRGGLRAEDTRALKHHSHIRGVGEGEFQEEGDVGWSDTAKGQV